MVRKLTPPLVRIAFGMALPLVGSWAVADNMDSGPTEPAPAVELTDDEPTYAAEGQTDAASGQSDSGSVAETTDEEKTLCSPMCTSSISRFGMTD